MKHLNLDQMNTLLNQERGSDWLDLAEHVASCEICGKKYRSLLSLKKEMVEPKRQVMKWALGAAAVLTMASYPYLKPQMQAAPAEELSENLAMTQESGDLLEQIRQINRQNQMQEWGSKTSVIDLIES